MKYVFNLASFCKSCHIIGGLYSYTLRAIGLILDFDPRDKPIQNLGIGNLPLGSGGFNNVDCARDKVGHLMEIARATLIF